MQEAVRNFVAAGREGSVRQVKWTIEKLTGGRKTVKKEVEYEVQFVGQSHDANRYIRADKLEKAGFAKHMKIVDEKLPPELARCLR